MGFIHWIGIDGTETVEQTDEEPSLERMQDFVGGYIELIPIVYNGHRAQMYVNEVGAIAGLPQNPTATKIIREMSRQMARPLNLNFPGVLGPAVILEGSDQFNHQTKEKVMAQKQLTQVHMVMERVCKGSVLYKTDNSGAGARNIYVNKSHLPNPYPGDITVTVTADVPDNE